MLAELLGGRPIFKGKDYIDQLNIVLHFLGTPSDKTLRRVGSPRVRRCSLSERADRLQAQDYIRSLPFSTPIPFPTLFPNANPLALDLLEKLLAFDPTERITCEDALKHPYLSVWHEESDEPLCSEKFDFGFEAEDTEEGMRKLIVEEVESFRRMVRPAAATSNAEPTRPVPVRQMSAPKRQDTLPLPGRDEIMNSPSTFTQEHEQLVGSPVEEGNELERELMFGKAE